MPSNNIHSDFKTKNNPLVGNKGHIRGKYSQDVTKAAKISKVELASEPLNPPKDRAKEFVTNSTTPPKMGKDISVFHLQAPESEDIEPPVSLNLFLAIAKPKRSRSKYAKPKGKLLKGGKKYANKSKSRKHKGSVQSKSKQPNSAVSLSLRA